MRLNTLMAMIEVPKDDSINSLCSSCSSISDKVYVPWGCELTSSKETAVFEVDYPLECQFFVRTICLSAGASDDMHVVAVCDGDGKVKEVPIATLHHTMPMVSFQAFELTPPVTFKLASGKGPVFITGQHITIGLEEDES
ncbi:nucleoplasmin-2a isoform X2 [Sardina pilchardus]|uniref:nucleoplasmin-2a isoform X2 n=1 Tax=Sardina pilchardus TaxID=27697 RepID=UPI002E0E9DAF